MILRPMKPADVVLDKLQFPLYVSPKFDGIRAVVKNGILLSNSLKPIRNKYIQESVDWQEFEGCDGELIVGSPTAKNCFNQTTSGVMSINGEPDFKYYVFDKVLPGVLFKERFLLIPESSGRFHRVQQSFIENIGDLEQYEDSILRLGYEGVMLRSPESLYKYGRSTVNEAYLLRLKRFKDSEAVIIGFNEQLHNANIGFTNNLGRTERSSHIENKVPMGTLGSLIAEREKVVFEIGTGFTDKTRQEIWDKREHLKGKFVKYKYFPIGVKDRPRFPSFLGFRDIDDISS